MRRAEMKLHGAEIEVSCPRMLQPLREHHEHPLRNEQRVPKPYERRLEHEERGP